MDEKKVLAQQVYQTLCDTLDARNWHYNKTEEKLAVSFGVNGDDLPMEFVIIVDEKRQLVRLMSMMSYKMPEEKRVEGAIATVAASHGMLNGSFDYNLSDGAIMFRMTTSYWGSQLGQGQFAFMIDCACAMVDRYNDKFFALSKDMMTIQDFLQSEA